jgi:CheY-like chemotaxis protein
VIDARRHELKLDLPDELLTVEGDKARLVQIIGNILHNAAKFTDPGGRISLSVRREGSSAAISVKDTGIGIPAAQVSKIFELFTQFHAKTGDYQGGLGIGLALVRRLTEMHGGTVAARSDGPGRGTELTVRLPLLAAQPGLGLVAKEAPESTVAMVDRRRILVVDDNTDAAQSLALLLELAGHDVRVAHDGVETLAVASEFEPEVVLLDLGMPKMDGYETARCLRNESWGQQVMLVALTGWGQQRDRERTAEAGFDLHLVKPIAEFELFQAIGAMHSNKPSISKASQAQR